MKCIIIFFFLITQFSLFGFNFENKIAVFNIESRNNVTSGNDVFSVKQALIVAGVPYEITSDFTAAFQYKFVILTSNIEPSTFTISEKDSIIQFVNEGGVLFMNQLKDDYLFDLAGVSDYSYSNIHYSLSWIADNLGEEGSYIDDENELIMQLTDSSFTASVQTRSYTLSTGIPLAKFENDSIVISKNLYGLGCVYLIGLNWSDMVLRNQVMRHFKAARTYSNGFEPGSDIYFLFIREVYNKFNTFSVYKHTSILNSDNILVITHDVDATSAIEDIMTDFSSYEYLNNIRSTYFITTHYMHDSVAKDFWNGYEDQILSVKDKNHEIASHSVSHVPDFDNSSIVPLGNCLENTVQSYRPFFNGGFSENVTVCGEASVSRTLLENVVEIPLRAYRTGYLAYNKYLVEGLEKTNYKYNSSSSANNVLTNFPYQSHYGLSMNQGLANLYEVPNTISDVFMDERISETNYNDKVDIWLDVQKKNAANYSPTILLIHPNRPWKITAQERFVKEMTSNTAIIPISEYADYWIAREKCDFKIEETIDSNINVVISNYSLPLHEFQSFIVVNGQYANNITVLSEAGDTIHMLQSDFRTNDVILYLSEFDENYNEFDYHEDKVISNFLVYPNPFQDQVTFHYTLINDATVKLKIYSFSGELVDEPLNDYFELGPHNFKYINDKLSNGIYFYTLHFNDEKSIVGKIIMNKH